MNSSRSWFTPFIKQCFVTLGVSLNMTSHGLVVGFSAVLFPQLRGPESSIQVDEDSESWIASVFGITLIIGNFINPLVMEKYGRKKTHLIIIIVMAASWYLLVWANSVTWLIILRIIQGLAMGFSTQLCPVMIAEYTSPKNRGVFLATVALAVSTGVLIIHTLGSFLPWRTAALISAIIMTVDFVIALFSPETPSWLIKKGRYEECKKVHRWLRGFDEEEELNRMIEANMDNGKLNKNINSNETLSHKLKKKFKYFRHVIQQKEFYKPIFIVVHIYSLGQWGGSNILSQYTADVIFYIVGDKVDTAKMTVVLTLHRVLSGIWMTIIMTKFKRRTLLISVALVNITSLLANAGYSYCRIMNLLPFDIPAIGIILIHIHMVSTCSGGVALGFIIAGEIFPLEYRSLAGGMSATSLSGNLFIVAKTAPYLFTYMGLHVAYCIYAGICAYSLLIIWIFLPETKDRTLQDIEDAFRNKITPEEVETTEPLTSQ